MKCKICGREAESEFCELHEQAHANLQRNYGAWKKAINISWTEYLREIRNNPYAGVWVKEVAQNLLAAKPPQEQNGTTGGL